MTESTVTPETAAPLVESDSKALLTLSFLFLWGMDAIVTSHFIAKHGIEMEANPIVRAIIEQWGMNGMYVFKWAVALLWAPLHQKAHWGIHVALNVIMLIVVCMGIIVARG